MLEYISKSHDKQKFIDLFKKLKWPIKPYQSSVQHSMINILRKIQRQPNAENSRCTCTLIASRICVRGYVEVNMTTFSYLQSLRFAERLGQILLLREILQQENPRLKALLGNLGRTERKKKEKRTENLFHYYSTKIEATPRKIPSLWNMYNIQMYTRPSQTNFRLLFQRNTVGDSTEESFHACKMPNVGGGRKGLREGPYSHEML